jgi:ATP-dependent Clp protease ATP-binding subunit ClpX
LNILTKPQNALVKQYVKLFAMDGIELSFTDGALEAMVKKTVEQKTGARGLRSVMERILMPYMFEVSKYREQAILKIDADIVQNALTKSKRQV